VIDEDGKPKKHRSIKGLSVLPHDSKGRKYTEEQYNALMDRTQEKAKRLWNELDKSGRARFE